MLRQQTPKPTMTTVKLFPRLAPTVITSHVRIERKTTRERLASRSSTKQRQDERAQVRARLLCMILDNERSRRNELRPNAS